MRSSPEVVLNPPLPRCELGSMQKVKELCCLRRTWLMLTENALTFSGRKKEKSALGLKQFRLRPFTRRLVASISPGT